MLPTRFRIPALLALVAAAIALGVVAASAQVGDEDPCRDACRAENSRCLSSCGSHPNPIECEATCQRQHEDCETSC